jgi:hypothetical protein
LKIICHKKNNYTPAYLVLISLFFSCSLFSQTPQQDSCRWFGGKPIYPYYHPTQPKPASGKDFHTLKKEFANAYVAKTSFSGIITIIFYINYNGETNYYRALAADSDYNAIENNHEVKIIANQFIPVIKKLGQWIPGRDAQNEIVNSRKFYSFKFNKGELVEILPK